LTFADQAQRFLREGEKLTAGIAFGLSRLTGMSATYWLGVESRWRQSLDGGSGVTGSAEIMAATRQQRFTDDLMNTSSKHDDKLRAALAAGALPHHSLELTAALVKTAMEAGDVPLFRAAAEATAIGQPDVARTIALARLRDENKEIASSALFILYGVEPGEALRHAYDTLNASGTSAPNASATAVLTLFYRTQLRERSTSESEAPQWLQEVRELLRETIESGHGDPYLIQGPDYNFGKVGEACRTFFYEADTQKRREALEQVAPRSVAIGIPLALNGVRDSDPLVRKDSIALLRLRNSPLANTEARRLLSDEDSRVSAVADKILNPR
jgi:hypothetical protein